MADGRVLVVNTTSDYIEWIRSALPGEGLFLTLRSEREQAVEPCPGDDEEILFEVMDRESAGARLVRHLRDRDQIIEGVVAYDCEALELAAMLAKDLSLIYPSPRCIELCRDKSAAKMRWKEASVCCPEARLVRSVEGVVSFIEEIGGPCVLKPVSGSGSELVVYCGDRKDCDKGFRIVKDGLRERRLLPLYSQCHDWLLAEEYIAGEEYSCDFTVHNGEIEILRVTGKIKETERPFGTITGYVLSDLPDISGGRRALKDQLRRGALALGIDHAVCMVDFILSDRKPVLLEMTPRPGGDCIPFMMKEAGMTDIITYAFQFSRNLQPAVLRRASDRLVGLRLHAEREGTIREISWNGLAGDPRVLGMKIVRAAGDTIRLPPEDYESWYLGHLVFKGATDVDLAEQCREIRKMIRVEMNQ